MRSLGQQIGPVGQSTTCSLAAGQIVWAEAVLGELAAAATSAARASPRRVIFLRMTILRGRPAPAQKGLQTQKALSGQQKL